MDYLDLPTHENINDLIVTYLPTYLCRIEMMKILHGAYRGTYLG
jgi:hypothetical protein